MKLAIHNSTSGFQPHWIDYCENKKIPIKLVDCYKTDIIQQINDCDALMWHFHQGNQKDILFAKQLLYSVGASGKKVFPDFHSMWHFDDKVGQKYLLESIGVPLVPSWVFYDANVTHCWLENASFPLVFKLRGGAGSQNVQLVKDRGHAVRLVKQAFGRGFSQYPAWANLQERIRKYRLGKTSLLDVAKGVIRLAHPPKSATVAGREKGYVYFQEFIAANDSDIRVIVIGRKAFAIKRMVRKGDFRASGSGEILYEKKHFDEETIHLAIELAGKLQSQCVAFDFVYKDGKPLVVEISYGFSPEGYHSCPGYWDSDLNWYEGRFNPYGWMVEGVLDAIRKSI